MKLTKAQLRNELRTLEAQHQADTAVIGRLLAEVQAQADELDQARKQPALADNVRLAHHLEQAEAELAQLRAVAEFQDARLAKFMADHPDLFREAS